MTLYRTSNIMVATFVAWQWLHLALCNKIKLYEDKEFNRLLIKTKLETDQCITLPDHLQGAAGSIITELCLILYVEVDCKGMSIKIDQLENQGKYNLYEVMHSPEERFGRKVKSLKRCSVEEGGESVNVDFYAGSDTKDAAYKYTDICECMNLPSMGALVSPLHKINNHGNCIMLYKDLDCKGQSFELKGGQSSESENLQKLSQTFDSVSPCGNYQERCVSISTIVTKFEIIGNKTRIFAESSSSNVAMAAKTTFRNNGSAVVTQTYSVSKKMTETIETYRVKTTSSFHDFKVAYGVQVEVSGSLESIITAKATASLSLAYEYQKNYSTSDSTRTITTNTTEYAVNQKIKVFPCSEYEVSSYVTMLENYPLQYVVTFEVTGVARDGTKLEADDLKKHLGGLDYIETKSNFTITAKGFGSMFCNTGLEAVISGEGKKIDGCKSSFKKFHPSDVI